MLATFAHNKAEAYDALFGAMYERHIYLQAFVGAIQNRPSLAPVISSMKEHISDRYASASVLGDDVARGVVELDLLFDRLSKRIQRPLSAEETKEIRSGVAKLLRDAAISAAQEESAAFAKNFMGKLNDIIIPALFRSDGIGFDFRTHRTLWTLGQDFRLWCVTRSHREYDGYLVFPTARMELTDDRK